MTIREKAICEAYTGITFLTGEDRNEFYKYLTELFGRPIYTHELPELCEAIKEASRTDFVKVCRGEYSEIQNKTAEWIPVTPETMPPYTGYGTTDALLLRVVANVDRCVCCGKIVPEGRQVCPICEAGGDV